MRHILQRLMSKTHHLSISLPRTWVGLCFVLISVLVHPSCNRCQTSGISTTQRKPVQVTVVDATNTSGCHYVLHQENGLDLLPVSFAQMPVDFYPEGIYQITFTPDSSAIYACTAEAMPVHILTCNPIQAGPPPGTAGIKPPKRPCTETKDPYRIPWMTQLMEQLDPERVTRYRMTSGTTAYAFQSTKGLYLFDCQGSFICADKSGSFLCLPIDQLAEPEVILVRNY